MNNRLERILKAVEFHQNAAKAEDSADFLYAWVRAAQEGKFGDKYGPADIARARETMIIDQATARLIREARKVRQN